MMTHSRLLRTVLAASALVLSACGKKSPTQPGGNTASISVSPAAGTVSVAQAASGTVTVNIARVNYTGDVALTAEGLPTGVTAAFTPATVTGATASSSLQLQASGSAAVGTSTVTIRASGAGVTAATTTVALSVTAPAGGSVTLSTTPATASIVAGQTTSSLVAITRAGGAAGVNLTVTGAPAGMTTSFSTSNPVTAASVTLSVTTTTAVVPGLYTLTARANAAGLTEATATFAVTVAAPPSNSVAWRFCDTRRIPTWFAIQDGLTGTWQRITEATPGVFNFNYGQPQVGVATVSVENSITVTRVRYFGLSEITAAAAAECTDNPVVGTKTITGTISGLNGANEAGTVSLGTGLSNAASAAAPTFTINRVPTGALDLLAIRANVVTSSVLRLLIQRGVNIPDGGVTPTLDLAAGTSVAPASGSLTITAPNDATLIGLNRFSTATGSGAGFTVGLLATGVAATYQGVPDASMITSDVQQITVTQSVSASLSRFISRYTRGPTAVTLAMPSDPGAPTVVSAGTTPYPRATVSGSLPAAFNTIVAVQFLQGTKQWELSATADGRAAVSSYSFTMPDFSSVSGWSNTWAMSAGTSDVSSTFSGQTGGVAPAAGTTVYTTGRKGTFTF